MMENEGPRILARILGPSSSSQTFSNPSERCKDVNEEQKRVRGLLQRHPDHAVISADGKRLYFDVFGVVECMEGLDFKAMNLTEIKACVRYAITKIVESPNHRRARHN